MTILGSKELDESVASMLFKLAKEHRKNCDTSDCGISLYQIGQLYKVLIGRSVLTDEEFKNFC